MVSLLCPQQTACNSYGRSRNGEFLLVFELRFGRPTESELKDVIESLDATYLAVLYPV